MRGTLVALIASEGATIQQLSKFMPTSFAQTSRYNLWRRRDMAYHGVTDCLIATQAA